MRCLVAFLLEVSTGRAKRRKKTLRRRTGSQRSITHWQSVGRTSTALPVRVVKECFWTSSHLLDRAVSLFHLILLLSKIYSLLFSPPLAQRSAPFAVEHRRTLPSFCGFRHSEMTEGSYSLGPESGMAFPDGHDGVVPRVTAFKFTIAAVADG